MGLRRTHLYLRLPGLLAFLLTLVVFLPALENGFVDWDDWKNIVLNPHYRGFTWENLRWMFSTTHMGHFQPLSWMTLALDYEIWGMMPFGYHLTNVVLHAANAGLVCVLCMSLLSFGGERMATPAPVNGWPLAVAALFGALSWSLHPLRVESVAWVTERRDVLSGFLLLSTLLCYLRWVRTSRRLWLAAASGAYLLSMLSKAIGMTLPIVLLILDVYPLHRLPADPRTWVASGYRRRLWEKLPFALMGVFLGAFSWVSQEIARSTTPLSVFGFWERTARAGYGLCFYFWKTVLPLGLSPCYELPLPFDPLAGRFLACGLAVCLAAWALWRWAGRWPALAAAVLVYAVTVAPVLGFVAFGNVLVADRYAYLPSLGFSVLAAAGLRALLRRPSAVLRALVLAVAAGLCLALFAMSWRQCLVWEDSASLWRRVLSLHPATSTAHHNLGVAAAGRGDYEAAARRFRQARLIWPHAEFIRKALSEALYNQGNAELRTGRLRAATASYRASLALHAGLAETHNNLALALTGLGRRGEACRHYAEALRLRPGYAAAVYNWGNALADLGELEAAQEKYRQALRIDGGLLEARFNLGNVLARRGRYREAAGQYRMLLETAPSFPQARESLAKVRGLGGF
jgi:tetratricopeptide (TPR) repeat protein